MADVLFPITDPKPQVSWLAKMQKRFQKEIGMSRVMTNADREAKAITIIGNAFPPAAGGALAAGGTTRPKLDMPLLPENLRIADGEADPNAVEVSREDLMKIKEVIDRLLAESSDEQQSQDATEEPPQAADSTDSTIPEKSFPAKKTQDDINGGDAPSQDDPAAEEDPLKRKYKGFFNAK